METEVVSAANAMDILKSGGADIALIEGAPQRLVDYIYRRFSTYAMEFLAGINYDLPEIITIEQLIAHQCFCGKRAAPSGIHWTALFFWPAIRPGRSGQA